MDFNEIKELISLVNDSELSYFEVKYDNKYIKMDKSLHRNTESMNQSSKFNNNEILNKLNTSLNNTDDVVINSESAIESDEDFEYIKSPMVGTFYRAISPEEPAFVEAGQKVSKGQVLCIVEAMKLMNEIVAEEDCEIISVVAENAKMVEYGEPMFKIRR